MQTEQRQDGPYGNESAQDRHNRRNKIFWNWSIGTVITAIIAFFPVNKAYVDYHVRLTKDVVVTEIGSLKQAIEETQDTADLSANKIDFLVKAEAARSADSLGVQLSILKAQTRTRQVEEDIYDLEQRLNRAVNYRDCVFAKRDNCDALRVW